MRERLERLEAKALARLDRLQAERDRVQVLLDKAAVRVLEAKAAMEAASARVLEAQAAKDAASSQMDAWSRDGPISQAMQAFLNRRGQP